MIDDYERGVSNPADSDKVMKQVKTYTTRSRPIPPPCKGKTDIDIDQYSRYGKEKEERRGLQRAVGIQA